jgi:hypothetical protein
MCQTLQALDRGITMGTPPEENKSNVTEDPPVKPTMLGGIVNVFKTNMGDTIAYLLLAASLLYCFFEPFIGGVVVGFIMGLYFSKYIFSLAVQFREFLITEGIFRGFIIIAALAALIITAPGLCLGLVVGTFTRPFFGQHMTPEEPTSEKRGEKK